MELSSSRTGPPPVANRARTPASVELSSELLETISDGLDIRDVFPRIARTARQLLQHDCLDLMVHDPFGNAMLRTRSAAGFPEDQPAPLAGRGDFCVVRDLRQVALPDGSWEQCTFFEGLAAAGYQSFLCIRARARERVIRLGFFSKRRASYTLDDVPVARLIAGSIAVVVAHEQLADAQRARVDARAHAEGLPGLARGAAAGHPRDRRGGLVPWQLRRATEYMTKHVAGPVLLKDLARQTGLSPSRFGRAFKLSMGISPHRWQTNLRVLEAQELLKEGKRSQADIALATGFAEQSHFSRVFKDVVGVPPGAWQRAHRQR